MRVLVTGVGGALGRFVAGHLAHRGADVIGIYRKHTPPAFAPPAPALLHCDLADGNGLPARYDAVFHAAATSPALGVTDEGILHDNVRGTRLLVEHSRDARARMFIFCSSLSVYGAVSVAQVDEETPRSAADTYGQSKLEGERLVAAAAPPLATLSLRLPAVIGPGAQRNFLAVTAARLRANETVSVFNPDAPFNNAVHCADIARFVAGMLEHGWHGSDTLVLGAAGHTTVRGAVERLRDRLRSKSAIEVRPAPRSAFVLSSARAVERYGYAPMQIEAMLDLYASDVLTFSASAWQDPERACPGGT
jgi:nucleoside-diphosphate-sugar epimerase